MVRLLLSVCIVLSAYAPDALSQVHQEPADQILHSHPQPSAQISDDHTQDVTQRRSPVQVRSSAHDSRVDLARPPWEYTSPEDAAVLEGWESRIPAAAARSLSEPAPAAPSALALAWQLYRRGQYDASASAFKALTTSADRPEALNARLGLAYSLIKQGPARSGHFAPLLPAWNRATAPPKPAWRCCTPCSKAAAGRRRGSRSNGCRRVNALSGKNGCSRPGL